MIPSYLLPMLVPSRLGLSGVGVLDVIPPIPPIPPFVSTRGISLTRYAEELVLVPQHGLGFQIRIEASNPVLMPDAVFVMRSNTWDPVTQTRANDFHFVASPGDFVDYPVASPRSNALPPYFRTNELIVVAASREIALDLWNSVQEAVCELVVALDRKDFVVAVETARCGDMVEPASQSMSMSQSV